MIFGRLSFFLILLLLVVSPFFLTKLIWLSGTKLTTATVSFMGKRYSGVFTDVYPVIVFTAGKDSIWFDGDNDLVLEEGQTIPVRYTLSNPSDARIATFRGLWVDTLVYSAVPAIVILALSCHPLVIPYRSRVRVLRKKPYLQLVS